MPMSESFVAAGTSSGISKDDTGVGACTMPNASFVSLIGATKAAGAEVGAEVAVFADCGTTPRTTGVRETADSSVEDGCVSAVGTLVISSQTTPRVLLLTKPCDVYIFHNNNNNILIGQYQIVHAN
jgi:hypothetical protein